MAISGDAAIVHVTPGMEVCDPNGRKIGDVAHVYEKDLVAGKPGPGSYLEVKTGFLGLGKHLFVPYESIKDITEGGVIVDATRDEMRRRGWETKPASILERDEAGEASGADADSTRADWNTARRYYLARWERQYKLPATDWPRFERRYQFIFEMANHPSYAGRSWSEVEPDLRGTWEVRYSNEEWNGVSEPMRDAWEHYQDAIKGAR